ncbi:Retrovirus-related Pol polyprotein from type-1 retrotransposable element R1 [Folsomia candida]|uniref:Retrovirus-related Pol polyprotein from type-1 retrotransposable element R1 n=1 Tax=Folsomia candida TaxID=158441 RepID=A0A226DAM1_FOLCA|nr:Retrovirus-related Pol polyprotein from type-1 retrotransposable element R1 [Folsomia candida]
MRSLVAYCESKRLPILIGCANAHHTLWGSTNCNERGLELLDYLGCTNLQVLNKGHEPTFVTKSRSEVLDLTLISADLAYTCTDWWVDREDSSSDHRYIRARFKVGPPPPVSFRNKLTGLRKEARKRQRAAKRDDESWEAYRHARAQYHAAMQSAKRKSWREYVKNLDGCHPVSRLVKLLRNDTIAKLGCLDKGSGVYTKSLSETAQYLLEQNFPNDSREIIWSYSHEPSADLELIEQIVTESKIKRAIKSFSPFKAAGGDGIFSALLQWGLDLIVPSLKTIFCGCLKFGFMPGRWRTMRVVFIPKPGKDSYERASSWRPISLTSFILKTLEKLIDDHIRSSALVERLKRGHQFAYMSGLSTEDALHNVVAGIERSLKSSGSTLGVFLDVKRAFNEAPFDVLLSGLKRHNIHPLCCNFISHMLTSRSVEFVTYGRTFSRRVKKGCPQGGVLSPLLWNLAVDELLTELMGKFPGIYTQGYADDVALLSSGFDLSIVRDLAQQALSFAGRWSRGVGLSLNDKSSVVLFTNKRKFRLKPLTLEGKKLEYSGSCTYLGSL